MSDNLYTSNGSSGHIRVDHIDKALRNAKFEGKLHGVDRLTRERFVQEFEKTAGEMSYQIGHEYSAHDVHKILDHMKRNKSDKITDRHIEDIREIMTDQNFDTN